MNAYSFLKLIHVIAVIIFMGNIITGLFWMRQAHKTRNFSIISFTMRGVIKSDKWFTIPGVIIISAAGFSAAIQGGLPLLRTGWIFWSIVLFTLSGVIFALKLVPLQRKILQITENKPAEEFNDEIYQRCLQQWEAWGLLALLTPFAAMAMMVLKIPAQSIF